MKAFSFYVDGRVKISAGIFTYGGSVIVGQEGRGRYAQGVTALGYGLCGRSGDWVRSENDGPCCYCGAAMVNHGNRGWQHPEEELVDLATAKYGVAKFARVGKAANGKLVVEGQLEDDGDRRVLLALVVSPKDHQHVSYAIPKQGVVEIAHGDAAAGLAGNSGTAKQYLLVCEPGVEIHAVSDSRRGENSWNVWLKAQEDGQVTIEQDFDRRQRLTRASTTNGVDWL